MAKKALTYLKATSAAAQRVLYQDNLCALPWLFVPGNLPPFPPPIAARKLPASP